jgi:hypothetical protein
MFGKMPKEAQRSSKLSGAGLVALSQAREQEVPRSSKPSGANAVALSQAREQEAPRSSKLSGAGLVALSQAREQAPRSSKPSGANAVALSQAREQDAPRSSKPPGAAMPHLARVSIKLNSTEALLKAAKEGNLKTLRDLLRNGTDINYQDENGWSALHHACENNQLFAVQELVKWKANIEIKKSPAHGSLTPLHVAAYFGYLDIVKFLIASGADPLSRDGRNYTPLKWAELNSRHGTIHYLTEQERVLIASRKTPKITSSDITVTALYDFKASESDELSFFTGEQIKITNQSDEGWWIGTSLQTGKSGMFPANYVEANVSSFDEDFEPRKDELIEPLSTLSLTSDQQGASLSSSSPEIDHTPASIVSPNSQTHAEERTKTYEIRTYNEGELIKTQIYKEPLSIDDTDSKKAENKKSLPPLRLFGSKVGSVSTEPYFCSGSNTLFAPPKTESYTYTPDPNRPIGARSAR